MPPPPPITHIDFSELLRKASDRKSRALRAIEIQLKTDGHSVCNVHLDDTDQELLQKRVGDSLVFERTQTGAINIRTCYELPSVKAFQGKYLEKKQKRLDKIMSSIDTNDLPGMKKRIVRWLDVAADIRYTEDFAVVKNSEFSKEIREHIQSHLRTWLEAKGYKIESLIVSASVLHIRLGILSDDELDRFVQRTHETVHVEIPVGEDVEEEIPTATTETANVEPPTEETELLQKAKVSPSKGWFWSSSA